MYGCVRSKRLEMVLSSNPMMLRLSCCGFFAASYLGILQLHHSSPGLARVPGMVCFWVRCGLVGSQLCPGRSDLRYSRCARLIRLADTEHTDSTNQWEPASHLD